MVMSNLMIAAGQKEKDDKAGPVAEE